MNDAGKAPHRFRVTLTEAHTDSLGHLNHVQAVRLFEGARDAYCEDCGLFKGEAGARRGTVVVNVNYDYRGECFAGEAVVVETVPTRAGTKSYTLAHRLVKPDGSVAVEGTATSVVMDMSTRDTVELPEPLRRQFV